MFEAHLILWGVGVGGVLEVEALLFTCRASPGARTQGARFSSPAAADRKLAIREDREDEPEYLGVFIVLESSRAEPSRAAAPRRTEARGGSLLLGQLPGCRSEVSRSSAVRAPITKAFRAGRGH